MRVRGNRQRRCAIERIRARGGDDVGAHPASFPPRPIGRMGGYAQSRTRYYHHCPRLYGRRIPQCAFRCAGRCPHRTAHRIRGIHRGMRRPYRTAIGIVGGHRGQFQIGDHQAHQSNAQGPRCTGVAASSATTANWTVSAATSTTILPGGKWMVRATHSPPTFSALRMLRWASLPLSLTLLCGNASPLRNDPMYGQRIPRRRSRPCGCFTRRIYRSH
jgi:hypothetical protein